MPDETNEGAAVAAPIEEKKPASTQGGEEKVEVPAKFKSIVDEVEKMSVLDLNELVKVFEKKFGVSAAAVAAPSAGGNGAAAVEEKSSFTVELTDSGAQKIAVIKVVKEALTLGLKDAKDKVDGAPTVLAENMKKEEAEALKKKIEEAGGKVTLK
jgi:large subunit ribosomal protein L7/L12